MKTPLVTLVYRTLRARSRATYMHLPDGDALREARKYLYDHARAIVATGRGREWLKRWDYRRVNRQPIKHRDWNGRILAPGQPGTEPPLYWEPRRMSATELKQMVRDRVAQGPWGGGTIKVKNETGGFYRAT